MSGTFRIKISDLRSIIRDLIGESIIAEKFGDPLAEGSAKNLRGHTCEKCKKGKYEETAIEDDWGGWLHCGNCNNKVKRWKTDESLGSNDRKTVDMYGAAFCDNCDNEFYPRATTDGYALDSICSNCESGGGGTCECSCEDCAKYPHDPNECACGTDDWTK